MCHQSVRRQHRSVRRDRACGSDVHCLLRSPAGQCRLRSCARARTVRRRATVRRCQSPARRILTLVRRHGGDDCGHEEPAHPGGLACSSARTSSITSRVRSPAAWTWVSTKARRSSDSAWSSEGGPLARLEPSIISALDPVVRATGDLWGDLDDETPRHHRDTGRNVAAGPRRAPDSGPAVHATRDKARRRR